VKLGGAVGFLAEMLHQDGQVFQRHAEESLYLNQRFRCFIYTTHSM
jgi:hypothetical protein